MDLLLDRLSFLYLQYFIWSTWNFFLYGAQIPTVEGLPSLVFFCFNIGEERSVCISNCDPLNELFYHSTIYFQIR